MKTTKADVQKIVVTALVVSIMSVFSASYLLAAAGDGALTYGDGAGQDKAPSLAIDDQGRSIVRFEDAQGHTYVGFGAKGVTPAQEEEIGGIIGNYSNSGGEVVVGNPYTAPAPVDGTFDGNNASLDATE